VTTVRGTLRSTEIRELEGSAPDTSTARAAALEQLDLTTFELHQANTVAGSPGGQTTVRAITRSRATRSHEASGPNYAAARQETQAAVGDELHVLHTFVVDSGLLMS
jgi:hypothetical protein